MKGKKNNFKIRETKDIVTVRSLHSQIFPYDDWYESDYESVYWLVFDSSNKEVGFAIITLLDDRVAFLSRVGVLSEARGHGLQRRLIRVRESYARRKDFTRVITYTKINNIQSSSSLQKSGYWLYVPDNQYADEDCLYWIKELSK